MDAERYRDEIEALRTRVRTTERRVQWLSALAVLLIMLVVVGAARASRAQEVLRAQGLVITDGAGNERIVIGAPMGAVSEDTRLAGAVGIAVLDSAGRLHVAMGANNPLVLHDGRIGTRIATDAGIIIYDPRTGQERGGMSAMSDGRANVCLDYAGASKEAACMTVAPRDQYAAVLLNGTPDEEAFDRVAMYVGADGTGALKAFGAGTNPGGVLIQAGVGATRVVVYDSAGNELRDLARSP